MRRDLARWLGLGLLALASLGVFAVPSKVVLTVLLCGVGVVFWVAYLLDHRRWWAALCAGSLSGLACVTIVTVREPAGETLFGLAFLLGLACAATVARGHWWVLSPGAGLWTLSAIAHRGLETGPWLLTAYTLAVMAAHFCLGEDGRAPWAVFPLAAIFGFALLNVGSSTLLEQLWAAAWPVLLGLAGLWVVFGRDRAGAPVGG